MKDIPMMAGITLRPATERDFDFLWWLHRSTIRPSVEALWGWDEAWQFNYFCERFDPSAVQIVVHEGAPLGMIAVERRGQALYLARIEIAPRHQGQGIGSSLIQDLLGEARRQATAVELHVLKTNPGARRLYERLGFAITAELEDRYAMRLSPQTSP